MHEPRDDSYGLRYEAVALGPDEVVRDTWNAARYSDALLSVGGYLSLTTTRLIFEPGKTTPVAKLLSAGMKVAGLGVGAEVLDEGSKSGFWKAWESSLRNIVRVDAIAGTDRLRVNLRNGESKVFRMAASARTPIWSKKNVETRDAVVATLNAAVGQ